MTLGRGILNWWCCCNIGEGKEAGFYGQNRLAKSEMMLKKILNWVFFKQARSFSKQMELARTQETVTIKVVVGDAVKKIETLSSHHYYIDGKKIWFS